MQGVSNKALWILVIGIAFFSLAPRMLLAEGQYAVEFFGTESSAGASVTSCSPEIVPIEIIVDGKTTEFDEGVVVGVCRYFVAEAKAGRELVYLVLRVNGESVIIRGVVEGAGRLTVPAEIKGIMIFIGGMLATVFGRVLSLLFDPLYQAIRVYWEYKGLKRFLMSVSDSFEYDLKISDDLLSLSKGGEMTNFLISPRFRRRLYDLLVAVEDWKAHRIMGEELRRRLENG
jgi:hypothetical protein